MTIPEAVNTIVQQQGKDIYKDIWKFAKMLRALAPLPEATKKEVNLIRIGVDETFLNLFVDQTLTINSRLEKIGLRLESLGLAYDSIMYLTNLFGRPLGYEKEIDDFITQKYETSKYATSAITTYRSSKIDNIIPNKIEETVLDEETLKQLGYKNKKEITEINIPKTFSTYSGIDYKITSIGSDVFADCTNLQLIVIPNSVKTIGKNAFKGCTSLQEVIMPNSVTFIGESAFENCMSLKNITIPNKIAELLAKTFYNCKSLSNIIIPDSVKFIGDSVFENCTSLLEIAIPPSVKKITKKTFYGCKSLEHIIIPNSVTEIEEMAFFACESLNNVIIPESISKLGSNIFSGCNKLKRLTIPVDFIREDLKQNLAEKKTVEDLRKVPEYDNYVNNLQTIKSISQEDLISLNHELYKNFCVNNVSQEELVKEFQNKISGILSSKKEQDKKSEKQDIKQNTEQNKKTGNKK